MEFNNVVQECIDMCQKCARECSANARDCLAKGMNECARVCMECADACLRVVSEGELNAATILACAEACNVCAAECELMTMNIAGDVQRPVGNVKKHVMMHKHNNFRITNTYY